MTVHTEIRARAEDDQLKARHRAMWTLGDYPAVADQVIPELGEQLVRAAGVRAGQRVLDVAAGSGNAALPAAATGADVTATDLTPALLDAGRHRAEARGLRLAWEEADAEALPYPDASFDVVLSAVGVMFAPHHQASADELIRVARPGATIALANWTPEGFIGQLFTTMRPYAPPPPPGTQPPPLWGSEAHVRGLFGQQVSGLAAERRHLVVDRFTTPEVFRDFFKRTYGPVIATYRANQETPERVAALDAALVDLAAAHQDPTGRMRWEYLLVTTRRADR
jgi:ubiquinone/menaquinone biosynthesis C-methylase UbiE